MSSPFRALRSRNFRLFFIGQAISLIGSWMTRLATAWLVYRLTDSAFLLGVVSFAGQVPSMVLPPLVGVWVDRWDRRNVLIQRTVKGSLAVTPSSRLEPAGPSHEAPTSPIATPVRLSVNPSPIIIRKMSPACAP